MAQPPVSIPNSNGLLLNTAENRNGDEYDHWCREFEKRRDEMQQRGTQAAHNALLRLGKREKAWRKQYLHIIASLREPSNTTMT